MHQERYVEAHRILELLNLQLYNAYAAPTHSPSQHPPCTQLDWTWDPVKPS